MNEESMATAERLQRAAVANILFIHQKNLLFLIHMPPSNFSVSLGKAGGRDRT